MGIILLAFVGLYLLVSLGVVMGSIAYARTAGKSAKHWGWGAGLVMYLIPFWDWIPTIATHQYYCATEAGFWAYKTPEQWMKENPGVMEGLVANKGDPSKFVGDTSNFTNTHFVNSRFNLVFIHSGPFAFHRWRKEQEIVDATSGEILARQIDFSTSQNRRQAGWSGWKFWLNRDGCVGSEKQSAELIQYFKSIRGAEK
ncbi:MAG: hypothetical protein NT083_06060 [Rhodocyclales bacterium]|nr:hypothetical protein [Rhodocyclales bacterium]